MILDQKGKNPS